MKNILRVVAFFLALACFTPPSALGSITSQTDKTGPTLITGLPQTIPVGFPFQASANLLVLDMGPAGALYDPAKVLTLGSDYTVTGGGYNGATQMQVGSIVVVGTGTHAVLTNDQIVVMRNVPLNQITSFGATGPLTIGLIEQALDKVATLSQQVNEVAGRSLQFESFEFLSPALSLANRKSAFLAFDSNGVPWFPTAASIVTSVAAPVSALNIAALKLIPVAAFATGVTCQVDGYYAANDGGGGVYVWNSTSTATDNAGSVIAATGVAIGRWLLQATEINILQWGAYNNGTNAATTTAAIQSAITWCRSKRFPIHFPVGTYLVTSLNFASTGAVDFNSGIVIYGDGQDATFINIVPGVNNTGIGMDFTCAANVLIRDLSITDGSSSTNCHKVAVLFAKGSYSGTIFAGLIQMQRVALNAYGSFGLYVLGAEQDDFANCIITGMHSQCIPVCLSKVNTAGITSPNATVLSPADSMTQVSFTGDESTVSSLGTAAVQFDEGTSRMGSGIMFIGTYIPIRGATTVAFTDTGAGNLDGIQLIGIRIEGDGGAGTNTCGSFTGASGSWFITGTMAAPSITTTQWTFSSFTASTIIWYANNGGSFTNEYAATSSAGSIIQFNATINTIAPGTGACQILATDRVQVDTLTVSGTLTPSSTSGIVGTTTNDSANAGSVGEYVSASIASGSAVALVTGTVKNITSVSLTAGDWDVSGIAYFSIAGGTTFSAGVAGTSSTSATLGSQGSYAIVSSTVIPGSTSGFDAGLVAPTTRYSLTTTTTVYLVCDQTFSGSTASAYGNIRARRVR